MWKWISQHLCPSTDWCWASITEAPGTSSAFLGCSGPPLKCLAYAQDIYEVVACLVLGSGWVFNYFLVIGRILALANLSWWLCCPISWSSVQDMVKICIWVQENINNGYFWPKFKAVLALLRYQLQKACLDITPKIFLFPAHCFVSFLLNRFFIRHTS